MSEQQTIMPRSGPPTILVVDDEPTITMLCKIILEQAGFSVIGAEGSQKPSKSVRNTKVPLI